MAALWTSAYDSTETSRSRYTARPLRLGSTTVWTPAACSRRATIRGTATSAMMIERGTYLVPTLVAPTGILDAAAAGAAIPEASVRTAREKVAAAPVRQSEQ
jgi:hypothetical protein